MEVRSENDENRAQPDLKVNFIYRLVYEILLYAIPILMMPYISRVLGADGVGEYSFSYSVISYFMMFASLGTAAYGTREIARNRDDRRSFTRIFWEIEFMSMAVSAVCLILWGVLIFMGTLHRMYFIVLTPFLLGTMFDISWFYMGLERIRVLALSGSIVQIAGVAALLIFVRTKEDVLLFCLLSAVTVFIANLSMWLFLPRFLVKDDLKGLKILPHFRKTLIYFVPTAAMSVYLVLDKTLIGLIGRDASQNGYYEQASRLIAIAEALAFIIYNKVATARLSYLFSRHAYEEIRERIRSSMDYIFLLGYGAAFGLLGIAHTFVPVFLGDGFAPAETLLVMMLPLIPVIGVSNCLGILYYIPAGKRAQSTKYIVAGAGCNLLLNLCLIPYLGAKGAVIATIAAELLISVLMLRYCEGYLSLRLIGKYSAKRIPAGIVMALCVRLLSNLPLPSPVVLLIQIASGAVIYVLLLLICKDAMLKDLFQKIRNRELHGADREVS